MAALTEGGVYTSIIGSFLLEDSVVNRRRCVESLLDIGIDFPAYPQLVDMGRQFLDDLVKGDSGIVSKEGRYKLSGKDIMVDVSPPGLEPFFWTLRYLEERGMKEKLRLKVPITGPFTLASYIETGPGMFPFNTATSNLRLVKQLAQILSKSCEASSEEASMISIDEPVLSVIVGARTSFGYREDEIIGIYNSLAKACGGKLVGTHVCGRISPRLAEVLLKTDLDFLSHEFHDTPENTKAYSPEKLKANGKMLSVGCLSSKNPRVESLGEILGVMEKFREYGAPLIFTPDCGFRKLILRGSEEEGFAISLRKLRNMVEAAKRFQAAY